MEFETEFESTMANLHDAITYFNLRIDLGELSHGQTIAIRVELVNAFQCLLNREFSDARLFVNRANAVMN